MLKSKKYVSTIICIPADLIWNEIKNILPDEKPEKTTGRPQLFLTEKCLMVSFLSSELDVSGKYYPKNMVLVPHAIEDFKNGENQVYLINY
jgi:hypothetical protein